MHGSARLFVLAVALCACTAAPTALDLRAEGELGTDLDDAFLRIPDGERAVAAETPAELPPPAPDDDTRHTTPRYVLGGDGTLDDCFTVTARGMPAIDTTGSLVATTEEQILQLTPVHGRVDLHLDDLHDPGDSTVRSVVVGDEFPDDDRACRRLRLRARRQVAAANAELASHRFRAMEPLPVQYGHPDAAPETYQELPALERPLQVIVQHGEAIVRIPGVKVHERHAMPDRSEYSLYAVHGDRETGVVVLTFADCIGDSCTCDPLFSVEIVRWSPATFAALDAHPCSDPEAEDGRCRGIDYGF